MSVEAVSYTHLHEAAAADDGEGTLAVTLFRAFSKTFLTDGEPDGQLAGKLRFSGRLFVMEGKTTAADLVRNRDALVAKPRLFEGKAVCPEGFSIESDSVCLSILKPAEKGNGLALRLVNYADHPAEAIIRCPSEIQHAYLSDMLENKGKPVPVSEHSIRCQLAPAKITTIVVTA